MLVLEAWILTFRESLVENARSLLVKVSSKMLALEAWSFTCGESLVVSSKSV